MRDGRSGWERDGFTRRSFLRAAGLGAAAAALGGLARGRALRADDPVPAYLTPAEEFGTVERGDPLPYTLPLEKRREVGLERETWRLEVLADLESGVKMERPLTRAAGTALDWAGLLPLGEKRAVRYLKVMTCNNMCDPLGVGLWEGVPLREVLWTA